MRMPIWSGGVFEHRRETQLPRELVAELADNQPRPGVGSGQDRRFSPSPRVDRVLN